MAPGHPTEVRSIKVRITAPGTGLLNGSNFPSVGEVVELPMGLALSLLGDERAVAVAEAPAETRETRAKAAPEKRATRARKAS